MSVSALRLAHEEVSALQAVRSNKGELDIFLDGGEVIIGWHDSDEDNVIGVIVGQGFDEFDARQDLNKRLAALETYESLCEEGGTLPHRYSKLLELVDSVALERGLSDDQIDDLALVKAWEEHSERSAANWLIPDREDVERLVDSISTRPTP